MEMVNVDRTFGKTDGKEKGSTGQKKDSVRMKLICGPQQSYTQTTEELRR